MSTLLYKRKNILIVGGDKRVLIVCKKLSDRNNVYICGIDKEYTKDIPCTNILPREIDDKIDIIIFPVVVSSDNLHIATPLSEKVITLESILSKVSNDTLVFGGNFSNNIIDLLKERKIKFFDYMKREELLISNAFLTAQGAVAIAINSINFSLSKSNVLLIGSGRITKSLSQLLHGFGCNITITARKKSDIVMQNLLGFNAIPIENISTVLPYQNIIFNTVPSLVLDEDLLHMVNPNALIIDLASKPGGVDFMIANELNLKCLWELGIPGRMTDLAAGEMIYDAISNIISERGETIE